MNLASRVESLNKQLGTRVLVTDETRAMLGDAMTLRSLESSVKGRERAVGVHELLGQTAGSPTGEPPAQPLP